jgi:hypothetical protein
MKLNSIEMLSLQEALLLQDVMVVRLSPPGEYGNLGPDGNLLWPEVLLCKNKDDATSLAMFLNRTALKEFADFMAAEQPESTWKYTDIDHYITEPYVQVRDYCWVSLVEPSIRAIKNVETLKEAFHD